MRTHPLLHLSLALAAAAVASGCSKTTPVAPAPGPLAGVVIDGDGLPAAGIAVHAQPVGGWWLYASHGAGWRDSARRVVMPAPGDTVQVDQLTLFPLAPER